MMPLKVLEMDEGEERAKVPRSPGERGEDHTEVQRREKDRGEDTVRSLRSRQRSREAAGDSDVTASAWRGAKCAGSVESTLLKEAERSRKSEVRQ